MPFTIKDIRRSVKRDKPPIPNNLQMFRALYTKSLLYRHGVIDTIMPIDTTVQIDFTLPEVIPGDLIPHVIYQTWSTKKLPPGMTVAVQALKDANPDLQHQLFDDADCRNFIKDNFPAQILYAYDSLIPGAYKADLWRYCVLYLKGGVYLDIKFLPVNKFSLKSIIHKEQFCFDKPSAPGVYNAFMITYPGNLALKQCIYDIYKNVRYKYYGIDPLSPTGPRLLGKYIKENDCSTINGYNCIILNKILIFNQYDTYRVESVTNTRYAELWNKKKIYNNIPYKEIVKPLQNNICVIATTLSNNVISQRRKINLEKNFSACSIPLILNEGITNMNRVDIMFIIIKNAMIRFKNSPYMYGIICDDDFFIIDNFMEELTKTVELLPTSWRSLHLCPGYLWGRKFRDSTKYGTINPEYSMDNISYHISGRFYINCNSELYARKGFWLGGPIAILLNKHTIDDYIHNFTKEFNSAKNNNDVVLTRILNNNDYICREPMLGYEDEQGGSMFT